MKTPTYSIRRLWQNLHQAFLVLVLTLGTWGVASAAATKPSNLPMMSVATGTTPNVMITLDNSGSMLAPFLDSYPFTSAGEKKTDLKEFYNWSCNGAGYTGPYRDELGQYYCQSTTAVDACPAGFTGPNTRGDGSKYCERKDPVYSCPTGFTGPDTDPSTGNITCSQVRYNYSCSDINYEIIGTTDATRTCREKTQKYTCPANYTGPSVVGGVSKCTSTTTFTYSCPSGSTLGTGADTGQCLSYKCASGWTLGTNGGVQSCYKKSVFGATTWDITKLTTTKTAANKNYDIINATAVPKIENPALVVATPYDFIQAATKTMVATQYDNVQEKVKNARDYGTDPYTSGVVRAQSRTTPGGSWYAMRSGQTNPLYYDPRITYKPRVNYTGTGNYESLPTGFVKDSGSESKWILSNSNINGYATSTSNYYPNLSVVASPTSSDKFTYVNCTTYTYRSCTITNTNSPNVIEITSSTSTVPLPTGHQRTDCAATPALSLAATSCSGSAERQNIRNWYEYYQTRTKILASSLGFALANPDNNKKMRLGFYNINYAKSSGYGDNVPTTWDGTYTGYNSVPLAKGVRPFVLGANTDNTSYTKPVFDWLYKQNQITAGGTPLHNAIEQVATYYKGDDAWYNTPGVKSSGRLSCRRAYNILFSDGAWSGSGITTSPYYNQTNLVPTKSDGTGSATLSPAFSYSKNGDPDSPNAYIAYPDKGSGSSSSLASITSKYYWATDLKDDLNNDIATRAGEATSWQNMKTYTIGYGLSPTGFTFDDIKQWQRNFSKLGYQSDLVPGWPSSVSSTDDKIDDFIHAGYTGGGASYSVYTSDDIKRAFDLVLADVVSASGNDAGVAVSGASSTVSTIEGSLKFTVDYKTLDNTGDVHAWRLNALGSNNTVAPVWSAADKMPRASNRNLSTLSSTGPVTLGQSTTLASLPADVKSALIGASTSTPTDSTFIRFLRGEEGLMDGANNEYRKRASLIAASVNAPPVFIGGRLNMGYDRASSTVAGKTAYAGYITDKGKVPGTLYAPTNDGQVHVLNAADDAATPPQKLKNASGSTIAPGTELWSYLVRGSLSKMQSFADPAYTFDYVLDGPLAEHDIYSASDTSWKQMVFGTLGRANKGGVYALNAPLNGAAGSNPNRIPTAADYKWDTTQPDMGYITNAATAGQTYSNDWVVLVGSGHYAGTGKAGLYVLNANTGALIKFLQLPAGYNFKRGLGGVSAVRDASRRIVAAYAGDDGGNLWRFDLLDSNPSNWGVSNNQPLFTTAANQPIYAAPAWTVHPGDAQPLPSGCVPGRSTTDATGATVGQQCGAMVIVGTGMMMDDDDKTNTTPQTIYGIWDKTPIGYRVSTAYPTVLKANLLQQTIDVTKTAGQGTQSDKDFYKVSKNSADWTVHKGWYLDLSKLPNSTGERVIGDIFNLGSNVFVSSVVPNTVVTAETCTVKSSPPNFLYALDALTGGLKRGFDQNGDGKADQFAIAYIEGGGFTRGSVVTQVSKNGNSNTGIGLPTEGDPDLAPKAKCTGEQGFNTGISSSVQVFDGCGGGWSRSWRQILVPPQ